MPSQRISKPISPGLVQASASATIRRFSALLLKRRFGRGTTSVLAGGAAPAVTGISSVEEVNCTEALEDYCLRMVTSLLTKL